MSVETGDGEAHTRHLEPPPLGESLRRSLTQKFVEFLKKEDGPTAVEYAVMLALLIVVCIAAITTLGSNANAACKTVGDKAGAS